MHKKKADKVNHVYYILGTVQMHAVYIGYSPGHTGTHDWHWHMVGIARANIFHKTFFTFPLFVDDFALSQLLQLVQLYLPGPRAQKR